MGINRQNNNRDGKHGSQPTHTGRNISNRGRIGLAFPIETCFVEAPASASRNVSLSLPTSGKCTLANLLENYYKECSIDYNCPGCNKGGKCVCRIFIQRLPPILTLHLNHFEYNISARKKQNYVDFTLRQLTLGKHVLRGVNLASYDLCAVSNHHGTMNGGHYASYCKPPQGDVWYQCDVKTVTRLRTPVKTSTAYLLFYDLVHADI